MVSHCCVLSLLPTPPTLKDERAGGSCWSTLIKIVADTNISWGSPPPPIYIAGETVLVLNRVGGPPTLCGGQCVLIVTIYPWTLTCCWPQGLLCSGCLCVRSIPSLTLVCWIVLCIVLCLSHCVPLLKVSRSPAVLLTTELIVLKQLTKYVPMSLWGKLQSTLSQHSN